MAGVSCIHNEAYEWRIYNDGVQVYKQGGEAMKIPISEIIEDPNNPRKIITDAMVARTAASMSAGGLKNAIKVQGSKLNAQGKEPVYWLISGHIRLLAAKI